MNQSFESKKNGGMIPFKHASCVSRRRTKLEKTPEQLEDKTRSSYKTVLDHDEYIRTVNKNGKPAGIIRLLNKGSKLA